MSRQLDMFGGPEVDAGRRLDLAALPPAVHRLGEELRTLAQPLRMGTSSWSFPGWEGLIWDRSANPRLLARAGLETYARHPLMRSVGLDRTYYGPMSTEAMTELRADLSPDFQLLVKAHAECTTVKFPDKSWYRSRAGQRNELFLEPEYATRSVVEPFVRGLRGHAGVLLFQFPPQSVPGGPRAFASRLAQFIEALPKGPRYAVEIRNPDYFTPRYVHALERVGASHCIVELPKMPDLRRQWEASGGSDRPALVMRWMLARHHNYETGKQAYAPFDALVDPNPEVRSCFADIIVTQLRAKPVPSFMIVNNKAEGSSPLSILRLCELLRTKFDA